MTPTITNESNTRSLWLPDDPLDAEHALTTAILIPAGASVRVPTLCCGPVRLAGGGHRIPFSAGTVGWIVVGGDEWHLNLFGHSRAAQQAARRRWNIPINPGTSAVRRDVEGFAGLIYRMLWKRVKSATPRGTDWIAQAKSVRAGALFLGRDLIHLFSVKTL
jgi:hypothetical protein